MFRFLDLSLTTTDVYPEVISRLKAGEIFLDLGCCFGQELRQLAYDGAPTENLYGSDLRPEFIELGYKLFKDKDSFKATFIPSDVFDDSSELLKQLAGKIDIIYTGSFFHLFHLEEQYAVARQVIKLLHTKPGSLIIGRQVGNLESGTFQSPGYQGERQRFRHNEQSWKEFWEKIGEETGTKWDVDVVLDNLWMKHGPEAELSEQRGEHGARRLKFVVRRI
jgi:SAM-dependent methyltransferase